MRRPNRRELLAAGILVLIVGAILLSLATRLTPQVREHAVAGLNARFQSEVELAELQVSVFPRPEVIGEGLILRHNGRRDVEPLIKVGAYSAGAGLMGLVGSPLRLRTIELERLQVSIPLGRLRAPSPADKQPQREAREAAAARSTEEEPKRLIIDRIVSRAARLEIVPRDRAKQPRVFDIHDLVMSGLGDDDGATFNAVLTNPTPRGLIVANGKFGPWHTDEPRLTPIRGGYDFKQANLNTIKGIAGTLSSRGEYSGVLERIEVKGETDTPDFSVDIAAQPVPLKTKFHAIVDGTNGDTFLERVEARVLETLILARGAVVRTEDVKGRKVSLDVRVVDGRIEDVLRLAVKSTRPLMTGRVRLTSKFLLPAGKEDVMEKLALAGSVSLEEARFTSVNIQERLNTLSQKGRGNPNADGPSVVSRLAAQFTLQRGVLKLTDLSFAVPGATVQLAGTLNLNGGQLDFSGNLLLDAALAETTTGFKSIAARLAQPFFRRQGGGSKLPIRITGTKEKPEFALDIKRALTPGK